MFTWTTRTFWCHRRSSSCSASTSTSLSTSAAASILLMGMCVRRRTVAVTFIVTTLLRCDVRAVKFWLRNSRTDRCFNRMPVNWLGTCRIYWCSEMWQTWHRLKLLSLRILRLNTRTCICYVKLVWWPKWRDHTWSTWQTWHRLKLLSLGMLGLNTMTCNRHVWRVWWPKWRDHTWSTWKL